MASESPRNLRSELAALRIDRGAARPEALPRRTLSPRALGAIVAGMALLAALVTWLALGGPTEVSIDYASQPHAGGSAPAAPVLSGSGYVVTADKFISIGTRIPGRIERFLVDEADRVRAGDPLVQLDDRDYKAALEIQRARLAAAKATRDLHAIDLERRRALRERNYASQAELDAAETQQRLDQARIAQIEAEIAQSQVNLDYTTLRAPTDGVILAKLKEVGEMAVPGGFAGSGELIRMANLTELRAEVDVSEADLSRVHLGQNATVIPDAFPDKRYAAKVVKRYPQVNRQKGTLKVEVQILEPDDVLLPDMSVRLHFGGEEQRAQVAGPPLVLAPKSAIRSDSGGSYAWVVTNGALRRQSVRTGGVRGDKVVVVEGLSGGEALVVGEAVDLSDGERVKAARP